MPEVTKNTGIKKPKASPSSLCSRRSSRSWHGLAEDEPGGERAQHQVEVEDQGQHAE